MADVPTTFGALLLGGLFAAALSGIVTTQAFVYMKMYPEDSARTKAIVAAVWLLDSGHTVVVAASIWILLINNFGEAANINNIPTCLALTVQLTAVLTFIVHCFYARRIHKVSHGDYRITLPVLVFAFLRLCSATATTAEMIHKGTFTAFRAEFRWLFTLGLALSCFVDILISVFLTYALKTNRKSPTSMDHVINLVILYTLETGSLTGAATVVSMIFWLVMPYNLIFMGLHFVISKLYANSLLATLNSRYQLQQERAQRGLGELPVAFPGYSNRNKNQSAGRDPPATPVSAHKTSNLSQGSRNDAVQQKVEITVEKTVEYDFHTYPERELSIHSRSPIFYGNRESTGIVEEPSGTHRVLNTRG